MPVSIERKVQAGAPTWGQNRVGKGGGEAEVRARAACAVASRAAISRQRVKLQLLNFNLPCISYRLQVTLTAQMSLHLLRTGASHHEASQLHSHQLWLLQKPDRADAGRLPQQALPSMYQQAGVCRLCSPRPLPGLRRQHLWDNRHHSLYGMW